MRRLIFAFSFLAGLLVLGLSSQHAEAQCTHLGNVGACPVNVDNGATSQQVLTDGILWNTGQISSGNQCCPADGGLGAATGLFDTNFGGPGAGPGAPFENTSTGDRLEIDLPALEAKAQQENRERRELREIDLIMGEYTTGRSALDDPELRQEVAVLAAELQKPDRAAAQATDAQERDSIDVLSAFQQPPADPASLAAENDSIMDEIESFNVGL